jgi:hypothetical protein
LGRDCRLDWAETAGGWAEGAGSVGPKLPGGLSRETAAGLARGDRRVGPTAAGDVGAQERLDPDVTSGLTLEEEGRK